MKTKNQTNFLESIRKDLNNNITEYKPGFCGIEQILQEKKEWEEKIKEASTLEEEFEKAIQSRIDVDLEKLNKEFEGFDKIEWKQGFFETKTFDIFLALNGKEVVRVEYRVVTEEVEAPSKNETFLGSVFIPTKIKIGFRPHVHADYFTADTIEELFEKCQVLRQRIAEIFIDENLTEEKFKQDIKNKNK